MTLFSIAFIIVAKIAYAVGVSSLESVRSICTKLNYANNSLTSFSDCAVVMPGCFPLCFNMVVFIFIQYISGQTEFDIHNFSNKFTGLSVRTIKGKLKIIRHNIHLKF